jgi:1-acyl-sn-glycerol-3-phosphate acyltransferase
LCKGLVIAVVFPYLPLKVRKKVLQRWSRQLLAIFNVSIDFQEIGDLEDFHRDLIVTNHISWLDVFVLNAIVPMRFVAKSEVRCWPVIGWLCERVQTLFIERGSGRSAARINAQLVELLKSGESIAVFPEGTTTDGFGVAHFHSSLIQPAIDAGAKVCPMVIRYHDAQGNHSTVPAYVGDLSFAQSLWNILTTRALHVQLLKLPTLAASGAERRGLTQAAQKNISTVLAALHAVSVQSAEIKPEPSHDEIEAALHFQSMYGVLFTPPCNAEAMRRAN